MPITTIIMAKTNSSKKKGVAVKISNKNKSKNRFAKRNASSQSSAAPKNPGKRSASRYFGKQRNVRAERNRDNKMRTKVKVPVVKKEDPMDMSDMLPPKDKSTEKRKRPVEEDDVQSSDGEDYEMETYEKRPRFAFDVKPKVSDGNQKIEGNNEVIQDEVPLEENLMIIDEPQANPEPSMIEMVLNKKQRYDELKERIGKVALAILSNPHHNIVRMKQLLQLLDIKDETDLKLSNGFIKIQSLVSYSILEIFRDILPSYRVREKITEESEAKNVRLKKETRELREFEMAILRYYKIFIEKMTRMVDCIKKKKKSSFYDDVITSSVSREKIATIGCRCLSHLMVSHPNFNLRDDIIHCLMPLLSVKSASVRQIVFDAVTKLYREDKLGQVSMAAVKATAKVIKANKLSTHPMAIKTFLYLKIKEVKKRPDDIDMRKLREKLSRLSRKEKRYNRKLQKLNNQLMETDASENQDRKLSFHTEILNHIFFVYFRFIKDIIQSQNSWSATSLPSDADHDCLTPVLNGLSKFCHLINVDFYDDLIQLLYQLISSGRLSLHQNLFCLHTVFTVLSGEGSAINVDPQRFYALFYVTLLQLNQDNFKSQEDAKLLHDCFHEMVFKRKKSLTLARVTAFIKRLAVISVSRRNSHPMVGLFLSCIRIMMRDHVKAEILLDPESYGSGSYNPELNDPEFCNATSSRIIDEMNQLKCHKNGTIRQLANCIINISSKKSPAVYIDLLKKNPLEVYQSMQS